MTADLPTAAGGEAFSRAARRRVLATGAEVVVWWALAVLVVSAWSSSGGSRAGWAVLLALAGAAAAACRLAARRSALTGAEQLAGALRARVAPGVWSSPGDAAVSAHALVELVDDVTDHRALAEPARRAALPSAGVVLAAAAVAYWPVAVLLALATPILPINMRLAAMGVEDAAARQLAETRRLTARLWEALQGLPTLRRYGATDRAAERLAEDSTALGRATRSVLQRAFIAAGVVDVVVTFSIAITATYVGLTLLGYVDVPGTPGLGLTEALFVLLLAPAYFAPLREYAAGYHDRDRARVAAERLSALAGAAAQPAPVPPIRQAPGVRLRAATVGAGGQPLLSGLDATLPAGSLTVLWGPSGIGKSSLLGVLGGFASPLEGSVDLDGLGPAIGRAGWLGPTGALLPGTVADNLRLAVPDVDDDRMRQVLRRVGLADLDLHTPVGEAGTGLSAGQARRVAVARLLLHDAALWLLDEPTAHLDAATEAELVGVLVAEASGRTVVAATHSPALAARADRVWELGASEEVPVG